jgi:flagellar biosynthesis/type III secretory pathway M-ring protein FliF/YscJ
LTANEEDEMATWIWAVIGVGVVLLLVLAVFGLRRGRELRLAKRREKTAELRQEADERTRRAEERERIAEEQAQQAREERKEAAEVGARAERLDPDRDS